MTLVIAVCLLGPYLFVKNTEFTTGHKVIKVRNTITMLTYGSILVDVCYLLLLLFHPDECILWRGNDNVFQ